MYGKKKYVEVKEIKYCSDHLGLLSGCYYLFIYAYDVKTTSIYLYHFLVAKSNPYFTFPCLRHQINWFPNISFGMAQLLSSACNGLFQTNVKR